MNIGLLYINRKVFSWAFRICHPNPDPWPSGCVIPEKLVGCILCFKIGLICLQSRVIIHQWKAFLMAIWNLSSKSEPVAIWLSNSGKMSLLGLQKQSDVASVNYTIYLTIFHRNNKCLLITGFLF